MGVWHYKFDLGALINNENICPKCTGEKIAKMIRGHRCFNLIDPSIAKFFDNYDSSEDDDFVLFDHELDKLYDYADENKIWLSGGIDI